MGDEKPSFSMCCKGMSAAALCFSLHYYMQVPTHAESSWAPLSHLLHEHDSVLGAQPPSLLLCPASGGTRHPFFALLSPLWIIRVARKLFSTVCQEFHHSRELSFRQQSARAISVSTSSVRFLPTVRWELAPLRTGRLLQGEHARRTVRPPAAEAEDG